MIQAAAPAIAGAAEEKKRRQKKGLITASVVLVLLVLFILLARSSKFSWATLPPLDDAELDRKPGVEETVDSFTVDNSRPSDEILSDIERVSDHFTGVVTNLAQNLKVPRDRIEGWFVQLLRDCAGDSETLSLKTDAYFAALDIWTRQYVGVNDGVVAAIAQLSGQIAELDFTKCSQTTFLKEVEETNTAETTVRVTNKNVMWGISKKATTDKSTVETQTVKITYQPVCTGHEVDPAKLAAAMAVQTNGIAGAYGALQLVLDLYPDISDYITRA